MKTTRKFMALILALTLCLGMALSLASCGNNDEETIEITDMSGTTVKIPKSPKKVAAVSPSTGDLMIAFGLGDLLDGTYYSTLNNPWAKEIYPESESFYGYDYDNSVETFVMQGVDLIFIPEPSAAQTTQRERFAQAKANVQALSTEDVAAYKEAFAKQRKYKTLQGYMLAQEMAKLTE